MVKAQEWVKRNLTGDPYIWAIVIVLSLLSILVVYSAISAPAFKFQQGNTEHYLLRHSILVFVGLLAMWLAHKVNYKYYMRISRLLLIISVPLLIYTYFFGEEVNGAVRWVRVFGVSFQSSDLAKLALISNMASMLAKRQKSIEDFQKSVFPLILWSGVICGLIALSDFSSSFLLFSTCLLLMFMGRVPLKYLFGLVGIGILCITISLMLGNRGQTFVSRIDDFVAIVNGDVGASEIPYQVKRANMAIARGGFMGVGASHSLQRYFLPEAFSDYVFAILIEEHGLKMGVLVIFLYLGLLWRGMYAVSKGDGAFAGLLSTGLSFSLVLQAFANMAVVVGLGPVTGLPLPFVSMGGTSLVFAGISAGIILSVSRSFMDEKNNVKEPESTDISTVNVEESIA